MSKISDISRYSGLMVLSPKNERLHGNIEISEIVDQHSSIEAFLIDIMDAHKLDMLIVKYGYKNGELNTGKIRFKHNNTVVLTRDEVEEAPPVPQSTPTPQTKNIMEHNLGNPAPAFGGGLMGTPEAVVKVMQYDSLAAEKAQLAQKVEELKETLEDWKERYRDLKQQNLIKEAKGNPLLEKLITTVTENPQLLQSLPALFKGGASGGGSALAGVPQVEDENTQRLVNFLCSDQVDETLIVLLTQTVSLSVQKPGFTEHLNQFINKHKTE